ncbi:hypothetical protein AMECASPLE_011555 [Ameca splendens]|uniref:Uncharacterized protein n=1 Tax=Ameca splendens TaxID=208324 RepID=A0ABV0Z9N9_9TELE
MYNIMTIMGTQTSLQLCSPICGKLQSMHCILTTSSGIQDIIKFNGSDNTGQPLLPLCSNDTFPCSHFCYFLGPFLLCADHCRLGTAHMSCSFGDALTQLSRHLNLVQFAQILTLAQLFLLLTHQL